MKKNNPNGKTAGKRLRERTSQLLSDLPAVYYVLKDPETPWSARVPAALVVIYALSPIDLIPDWIPVLGYLDDLVILPLLIALVIRSIPGEAWERAIKKAEDDRGKPLKKRWLAAIPILAFWALVILVILRCVL